MSSKRQKTPNPALIQNMITNNIDDSIGNEGYFYSYKNIEINPDMPWKVSKPRRTVEKWNKYKKYKKSQ